MAKISRKQYNDLYGPTVGDKIRLANSSLFVEIERDLRGDYGDEVVYGGGKTLRDGMGLDNTATSVSGSLDLVITNVTIIDAVLGVVKADVGIKDGKIAREGTPEEIFGLGDELLSCGLDVPQITKLINKIRASGISLSENIYTVSKAEQELLKLFKQ